jgi:hypothetical protein
MVIVPLQQIIDKRTSFLKEEHCILAQSIPIRVKKIKDDIESYNASIQKRSYPSEQPSMRFS